jgi:hypothetical protein
MKISGLPTPAAWHLACPACQHNQAATLYRGDTMARRKAAKSKRGVKDLKPRSAKGVKGGGVYRITNVRANTGALGGGSAAGATPIVAG